MIKNELGDSVNDAVSRINKALDLRFEADTTLYITKKDTDKIKHCLANNNYQNLSAFTSRLGQNVVAKVILKNCWLIDFEVEQKFNNKKILEKIFKDLQDIFFVEISEPIINDEVFSSIEFKQFIEKLYYKKTPIKQCERVFNNSQFKINCRGICFERYINKYAENNPGSHLCREISSLFKKFPELDRVVNVQLLSNLTPQIDDKQTVAKWIIEEKINKVTNAIWSQALLSLKNTGFEETIKYLSQNEDHRNETSRYLIEKLYPKFFAKSENVESLVTETFKFYKDFIKYRFNLIKMLTPRTFFDEKIANGLLDQFESLEPLRSNTEKFVTEIRNWSKEDNNGFDSIEKMRMKLESPNQDVTNEGMLTYFSYQLKKSDINIVIDFYEKYGLDNIKIITILSNFFASTFKKNQPKELKKVNFSSEYINKISYFINKNRIKNSYSKSFLEEHRQFEIITTLFER